MLKMKFTFYLKPIFFKPASYWNKIVEKRKTNFEKKNTFKNCYESADSF